MGKDKTKEECRKLLIKQAAEWLREKRTIFVIGQNEKDVDYIYALLTAGSLKHCKFLRGGGKSFLKDLNVAQIMLLQGYISGILFADRTGSTMFEKNLRLENNLDKCFEVPHYFYSFSESESMERIIECFSPMNMGGRINTIQFDITDRCNLNCALCSHFSPLVKEENKYSVKQFEKDVWRLRELTECIEDIALWGGEALLHPQLDQMIDIVREAFPKSGIAVGTNGILIPSISDKILDAVKRNNCTIKISGYPPTMNMVEKIEERLKEKKIGYKVTPVDRFFKRYELLGKYEIAERHSHCGSKVCHVVKNGTYSSCYFPYGAEVFNKYFGDMFDVNSSIFDLYDKTMDMMSFTQKVKGALDVCRFCGDIEMHSWRTVGSDKADISSWVNRYDEYMKESGHDQTQCETESGKKWNFNKLISILGSKKLK